MAKAKKLPSGRWRTRLFIGYGIDGKPKYKSFTADTKKESEYLAEEYHINNKILSESEIFRIMYILILIAKWKRKKTCNY